MSERLSLLTALLGLAACSDVRTTLLSLASSDASAVEPAFEGPDATRPQIAVRLVPVARDLPEPTDIQFPPGDADRMVVLSKSGVARWVRLSTGERGTLLQLDVSTRSEMGLLGLAFHPQFELNGLVIVNYCPSAGERRSVLSAFTVDRATWTASGERVLLEVAQPYANHDAGQLAFGPDGMLYVGWGDGGSGGDPRGNGQDATTLLGAMLRIDVDRADGDRPYAVPADNPFVGHPAARPEIWATGLRNPWRFSFAPDGRLVVADVGQDAWEEIDVVERGDNLGWNTREGRHCYPPDARCDATGFTDPVYEYSHEEGQSVTGGYVYSGKAVPALGGKYVFGDFVDGRIWAIDLPVDRSELATASALGRWPILLSTFGRDADGELYVADYGSGTVYRLAGP